ncbi:LOW QUALITY PROTEIN: RxLR effector protein [Phytophthora megakarya]|uniref:RxLR effector protein n=1 Tax=Phytophthora megakarya TaxID=4795 RepID=A0A225VGH6_9STRA|nr:LOW QUALITY PROTEIN: RxLR effector protein [Phytophthora megakarya]
MQLGHCAITYSSKSQRTVALSSTEYMALTHGTKEVIFLRELLSERGMDQNQTIVNVVNNLSTNPVQHSRMKHIDTRYHFVRERIATEEIGVEYVSTKENVADLLTKAVTSDVMQALRGRLGVQPIGEGRDNVSSHRGQARWHKRKRVLQIDPTK